MGWNKGYNHKALLLTIAFGLVLSACGGDKSTALESSENSENNIQAESEENRALVNSSNATSPLGKITTAENVLEIPLVADVSGRLLVVQGNTVNPSRNLGDGGKLYLATFDGTPPLELAARVYAPSLEVLPDGKTVIYLAIDRRSWYLYSLNLDTLEPTQLYRLGGNFYFPYSASPDGEWLVLNKVQPGFQTRPDMASYEKFVVRLDGSASFELADSVVYWLTDNQLVVVYANERQSESALRSVASITILDPTNQESTPLDLGLDLGQINNGTSPDIVNNLIATGYNLADTTVMSGNFGVLPLIDSASQQIIFSQRITGATAIVGSLEAEPFCADWEITAQLTSAETDVIYEPTNIVQMTDFLPFNDGYLFEEWQFQDCNFELGSLTISLKAIQGAGEPILVTDALYAGQNIDLAILRTLNGPKYDLSPDGQYVAWVGGIFDQSWSTLNLTDMTTGDTAVLIKWSAANQNDFQTHEMLSVVQWVP